MAISNIKVFLIWLPFKTLKPKNSHYISKEAKPQKITLKIEEAISKAKLAAIGKLSAARYSTRVALISRTNNRNRDGKSLDDHQKSP